MTYWEKKARRIRRIKEIEMYSLLTCIVAVMTVLLIWSAFAIIRSVSAERAIERENQRTQMIRILQGEVTTNER